MPRFAFAFVAAVLAGTGGTMAQSAADIGTAAATKNEVEGSLGATARGLKIGDRIFQNERIRTGKDSAAQLLFRDETSLSMGADSALVLDKAVYDPQKRTGEITVRAVSGAFRFVSGSSPSNNYKIKTSAGTIGVRGTIIDLEILGESIVAILREGNGFEYCRDSGGCVLVDRVGHFVVINGGNVSDPRPIGDHVCGMTGQGATGLGGGQRGCGATLIGNLVDFVGLPGPLAPRKSVDFQPGTFAGGAPVGAGPGGPGAGPGSGACTLLLPNGKCYPGQGGAVGLQ